MPFFVSKHIAATGVTTVSISQYANLHGVVMNQLSTASATTTTGLVTVYNATTTAASTDASVIAIFNPAASGVADYIYDCEMPAGITLQVGSAVAPLDMTITYS